MGQFQPISYLLHFLLSAFNGLNIDANKSFINKSSINSKIFNSDISLTCVQDKFLEFDCEGNQNLKFDLIDKGVVKNVLCDLSLANMFNSCNTATQYNFFSDTIGILGACLNLKMEMPHCSNFDFEIIFIDPASVRFDLLTGSLTCKMMGYENGKESKKYILYKGNILDLFNKAKYTSSEKLNFEEYSFKSYIIEL